MKTKTTGKRFSRIETTTACSMDEWHALSVPEGRRKKQGGRTVLGITFDQRLDELLTLATNYLRARNLPATPFVYWEAGRDNAQEWQSPHDKRADHAMLDAYIIDSCGYQHDSVEGLCARIIAKVELMHRSSRDAALGYAFEIGELATLVKVYNIDAMEKTPGAKAGAAARWKGNEARAEKDRLVLRLAKRDEETPSELWPELFGDMDSAGLEPQEKDDKYIYAENEVLTFNAFRKAIQRARK